MNKYCYVTKLPNGDLRPNYDEDRDLLRKLKTGKTYKIQPPKEARNYEFLKKFMGLMKLGWDNTRLNNIPFDSYRKLMTMRAGYFNTYETDKGFYHEAKSIAFDKMNQDEFEELYSAAIDTVAEDIGASNEVILQELMSFV